MGTGNRPPVEPTRHFAGLSRNVVVLSWVSFFQDAASEMLYPVLPLFLTGVLGAPPSVVGLIEGLAGLGERLLLLLVDGAFELVERAVRHDADRTRQDSLHRQGGRGRREGAAQ